jgi:CHASE2 domain-containing sensor protein
MNRTLDPRRIWRRMPKWLAAFVSLLALLSLQQAVESASEGTLKSWAYRGLLRVLRTKSAKVVIVDISDLRPVDGLTPRASLEELVLALQDACAKAVAIDIDFSPDHNVFVGQTDPEVFERWRRSQAPVILGVERSAGGPPEAWLGKREFAALAGGIVVPYDAGKLTEHSTLPGQYPVLIPRLDANPRVEKDGSSLPTLAVALAATENKNLARTLLREDSLIDRFTDSIARQTLAGEDGPKIPQFAVDYSSADQLEASSILAKWQQGHLTGANDWSTVEDKLVLVGDVRNPSAADRFPLPDGRTTSGVVHHAAATTTLLTTPLRVFGPRTRAAANIVCVALVLTIILPLKKRRRNFWHSPKRIQKYLVRPVLKCLIIFGFTLTLSVAALHYIQVLWIDCLVMALGGVLDAFIEEPKSAAIDLAGVR